MQFLINLYNKGNQLLDSEPFIGVLIFLGLVAFIWIIVLPISYLFQKRADSKEKLSPYECGIPPVGDAFKKTMMRYFIIAMLFVVFDVETVFLYPWAVRYKILGFFGFVEMTIFIALLWIGYVYAWKKGALEWLMKD